MKNVSLYYLAKSHYFNSIFFLIKYSHLGTILFTNGNSHGYENGFRVFIEVLQKHYQRASKPFAFSNKRTLLYFSNSRFNLISSK
jgi:hypothetical protein